MIAPIFDAPSDSTIVNIEPAGTETTMFAVLDVSILERIFNPQVTSALTRADELPVETGTVVGGV